MIGVCAGPAVAAEVGAADEGAPVLTVTPQRTASSSYTHPGHTYLFVTTLPQAQITIVLRGSGTRAQHHYQAAGTAEDFEIGNRYGPFAWSCKRPGTYAYTVTATAAGTTLVRHGHYSTITAARCRDLAAQARRRREEDARAQAEAEELSAAELRRGRERFERNCRAEGGAPTTLENERGEHIPACRAPGGGLLEVPVE